MKTSEPLVRAPPAGEVEGDINGTECRAAWQAKHLDADTQHWLRRDEEAFLHQALSTPCLNALVAAEGVYLVDAAGRRIMDFHGNSAQQLGYGHPAVVAAVERQMRSLSFCPRRFTNAPATILAERLTAMAPGRLGRVLLAPGGSTAVGIAIKLSRLFTGRSRIVSMHGSFHGASLDAASVGGEAHFRDGLGPLLPGTLLVPPPDPLRCGQECGDAGCGGHCVASLEHALSAGDVAAVIAEPVRCTTVAIPPAGYWKRVRAACDRFGTLLVFDEIPTCLGRSGRTFVCQCPCVEVDPDILVLGKGLGGGIMPLAAIIARDDLNVAGHKSIGHYTHEKSPVAAAAALATLDVLELQCLPARAEVLGAHTVTRIEGLSARHAEIRQVRGLGLMIAVEIAEQGDTYRPAPALAERVMYESMSRGLSFKVSCGNVITLTPPLIITREQIDRAIDILDESFVAARAAM